MAPQGRQRIGNKKEDIYRCAKGLFSEKGFKDTNVPEITAAAGIAAGTFYLYYTSKEQLFMEIYDEENQKLKQEILADVDINGEPVDLIRKILKKNLEGMTANPILREWYNKDIFNKIEEKFLQSNSLEKVDFMYDFFMKLVEKWQADGKMRSDIDSDMIMALFGCVIMADTHKDEIGLQYFPKVQEYLMEFLMQGLDPTSARRSQESGTNAN